MLDQRLQLLQREGRLLRAVRAPAVVGVHLDPVGAVPGLLAHGANHLGDAARLLRALRRAAQSGAQPARRRTVAGGGHDGARRHEQARAGDQALLDGALQRDVGVPRALGAQVAQRGEAGQQRGARLHAGASVR